jgi:YggT family protein
MPLFTPPFPILSFLVKYGIGVIILAMLIRAIASWFRLDERYAFIRFLARLTDPFITPVRRVVRPVGIFDLSFIVTWFLLVVIQQLLLQALPVGW